MITQNYPEGFIGNVQSSINLSSESVSPIESSIPMHTSSQTPTSELQSIEKEIRKTEQAIKTVPEQSKYALVDRLKELQQERSDLIRTGNAYTTQLEKIQEARKEQPSTQSSKDITFTTEGYGVSKAYALQTQAEKERTAEISANLISTSQGIMFKGGQDGSVYTGSNNRINPYDTITPLSSQGSISKTIPQGKELRTEEVFGKPTLYDRIIQAKEQAYEQARENPIQAGIYNIKGYAYGIVSVPILVFTKPLEFAKGVWSSVTHPIQSAQAVGEQLKTQPEFFIGQQIGTYGTFKSLGLLGEGIKTTYIKTGSEFVEPSKVFSSQVLEEGKTFPMSKGTSYALEQFNKENIVSTASPKALSGTVVGIGKSGGLADVGLEDPGIYVTPRGEGSPAFLGIDKQQGYSFTLNPIKPLKQFFSNPTVTEFEVQGVRTLPREVVSQPGFEPVKAYFELEGGKSGYAFITKRSELGQGELKPQEFNIAFDKVDKVLGTKRTVKEFGTTELEAVVPYSAKFEYTPKTTLGKIKGFEQYTVYNNKVVPIRRATLLIESDSELANTSKATRGTVEDASLESSSALSSEEFTSPVSSVKYVSNSSSNLSSSISDFNVVDYSSSTPSSSKPSILSESYSNFSTPSIPSKLSLLSTPSIPSKLSLLSTPSTPSVPNYPSTPSTPRVPNYPKVPRVPPILPTNQEPVTYSFESKKKKSSKASLFVKRKGKFELKGSDEDLSRLFKQGEDILSNTASASFKVVEDNKNVLPNFLPRQFTKSKRTEGVVVQKREFRISSFGEKLEIPGKAHQLQKARRGLI